MAFAVASAGSGCRFGNRVEFAPDPDQTSGYYGMTPVELQFCHTTTTTTCRRTQTQAVPGFLANRLTHPIALIMTDLGAGEAQLINPFNVNYGLPALVNISTGQVNFEGMRIPEWAAAFSYTDVDAESPCASKMLITLSAQITSARAGEAASGVRLRGSLGGNADVVTIFSGGECAQDLARAEACYLDSTACPPGARDEVVSMFGPWVESGVIAPEAISETASLSYLALYE